MYYPGSYISFKSIIKIRKYLKQKFHFLCSFLIFFISSNNFLVSLKI